MYEGVIGDKNMSDTYNAAAIIGCRIPKSKVFVGKPVRGCDHDLPQPYAISEEKFCNKCGKPLWVTLHEAIPEYDYDQETLCGLRVFGYEDDYDDFIYVSGPGAVSEYNSSYPEPIEKISKGSIEPAAEEIESVLFQHGLWDETQFGIWLIVWCS